MYSISINSILEGGGYSFKYTNTIKILFPLGVSAVCSFVFRLLLSSDPSVFTRHLVPSECLMSKGV